MFNKYKMYSKSGIILLIMLISMGVHAILTGCKREIDTTQPSFLHQVALSNSMNINIANTSFVGEYDLDMNPRYVNMSDTSTWDGWIKKIDVNQEGLVTLWWRIFEGLIPIDMGAYEHVSSAAVGDARQH